MATFYVQLENKLLQISGELTAENISKALGYVPVSPNVTNELSQRVDNISFDTLKDNPFLQDGSGELNIVDETGNIIAKIDAEGIHSVDFIAGEHRLSNKIDKTYVDEAVKNVKVDLTGYATEEYVNNIDFYNINNNPIADGEENSLTLVDDNGNIGLKVTEDGLHVKDVIAGNHKLTDKIDSSALNGYATEEWVEDKNYLTEHQDISHLATKDEVSNINFYNIKDNPIVNNGDGKLLFVDENGYIGLQLEEDGLYVKDVIADGHTLSQKADKSDIPSLNGYATESYVNTELENYATKEDIKDIASNSTITELSGKVSTLIGEDADKSVRTIANEELLTQLLEGNDNFQTLQELAAWIDEHPESAAAMNEAIQKNASDITNTLTFAKSYTDETIADIDFYSIKNNPIVNSEDGTLTFVDESGYIGLKVTEDGLVVKDVVTPEHTLSNKADKSELPTKVSDLTNDSGFITLADMPEVEIPSLDEYVKSEDLPNFNEFAKTKDIPSLDGYVKTSELPNFNEFAKADDIPSLEGYAKEEDIPSLEGYATQQWVNEQSFLKEHQDITHLAEKSELPTKTSDLTNDSGFITINDVPEVTVPTKVSELENDEGYLTEHQDISHLATKAEIPTVPTKVSELENDSKFITIDEVPEVAVPTKTSELTNDSGFITLSDVPVLEIPEEYVTETELNNKGFLTEHQNISHLATKEELNNKANKSDLEGLATESYVITKVAEAKLEGSDITIPVQDVKVNGQTVIKDMIADIDLTPYAKSEDVPSIEGLATEQWVTDKNYLTQHQDISHLASTEYVNEQIANVDVTEQLKDYALKSELPVNVSDLNNDEGYLTEHQDISHLATKDEIPSLEGYAKTEDIPSLNGYVQSSELPNFNEFAKTDDIPSLEGYAKTEDIPSLEEYAKKSEIPSLDGYAKTSELPNFDEFAKTEDIPSLEGYAKSEDIPSLDGYAKSEDIPSLDGYAKTDEIPSLEGYAKTSWVTEYVTDVVTGGSVSLDGYATEEYVNNKDAAVQQWVNEKGYTTQEDIANIDFYSIKDNPIINNGDGKLVFADENGNIGLQIEADNTIFVKDVIAGDHVLSHKADKSELEGFATEKYVDDKFSSIEIPDVDFTGFATEQWVEDKNYLTEHQDISHLATKEEIPSLDGYAKTSDIPSLDGYAKTEDIPSLEEYATKQ